MRCYFSVLDNSKINMNNIMIAVDLFIIAITVLLVPTHQVLADDISMLSLPECKLVSMIIESSLP